MRHLRILTTNHIADMGRGEHEPQRMNAAGVHGEGKAPDRMAQAGLLNNCRAEERILPITKRSEGHSL